MEFAIPTDGGESGTDADAPVLSCSVSEFEGKERKTSRVKINRKGQREGENLVLLLCTVYYTTQQVEQVPKCQIRYMR